MPLAFNAVTTITIYVALIHIGRAVEIARTPLARDGGADVRWSSVKPGGSVTFGFHRVSLPSSGVRPAALMRQSEPVRPEQVEFAPAHPATDRARVAGSAELTQHESHGPGVQINTAVASPAPTPSTTIVFTTAAPPKGKTMHPLWFAFVVVALMVLLFMANFLYHKKKKSNAGVPMASQEAKSAEAPASKDGAKDEKANAGADAADDDSDDEALDTDSLSEDTYGMAIACVVRDMQHLAGDNCAHRGIRTLRICASLKLLIFNMCIQIFLMVCIANFSCAKAVFDIRDGYSKFEKHMYNNHVYLTGNGNYRGIDDKYFNASLFNDLDPDVQGSACRIPLSQPEFLFLVLLIWSIMVMGEIRQTVELFERLILSTGSTETMLTACIKHPDNGEESVIMGLTIGVKVLFVVVIVIPRLVIASILLWLGCRWLTATTDFQNLVLNTVGLEFLLLTKDLLYASVVPSRTKRDTCRMKINVKHEATIPSPNAFLGTFLWGFVAAFWVYIYFCYQQVLPDYRWDVRTVCVEWMKANFAGWT